MLEGPMYAVGGHDGWSYLNTVERWDPQARQWNYVASMSTPRSTVGVAALNSKYGTGKALSGLSFASFPANAASRILFSGLWLLMTSRKQREKWDV